MSERGLTEETFNELLRWLDPDRGRAGEKYERIRLRLIRILSGRGCWEAEDVADQSINVVAAKVDGLQNSYKGDPALYFYAVAKNLFHEWRKKNPAPNVPPPEPGSPEIERLCGCLDQCLEELTPAERKLVLDYHEGEKQTRISNRKQLAQELGISLNALRIKVCHIHHRLRGIMEQRLEGDSEE